MKLGLARRAGRHAARHVPECAGLAANISDFGKHETHQALLSPMCDKRGKNTNRGCALQASVTPLVGVS
ncbi:DUF6880 family protein [Methylosinus sp. KRF6]|uniref:DUF6880 family protein n=1 Tax=Methylosinus sp. KRF6 TaxID=2846853 RepID=UPI0035300030